MPKLVAKALGPASKKLHLLQIVRMDDPTLCPEGWEEERPPQNPNYRHPVDMSVYELHIRDFSISDPRVPEQHRGKYAAFAQDGLGVQHLRELQAAGLTHVHLLPAYDYGSVPEKAADQRMPEVTSLADKHDDCSVADQRSAGSACKGMAGHPNPHSVVAA